MALQGKYKQFLANPNAEVLATNVSINYMPSLSTITEPTAILKHLKAQDQQLKKKAEIIVHVVEGDHSLCVETNTTLEFLYGGGAYLPGLDDNFLSDRTVTLPIVHIVTFDLDSKIQRIRLYWDQGSLLRSIDVIGARGRGWPLREGPEQSSLLVSSATTEVQLSSRPSTSGTDRTGRRQSRVGANGDPHTSLALFSPREFTHEESPRNPVSPRESAKPPPRDWTELFPGEEAPSTRSSSPSKKSENPLKAGAGTHHQPNRLFDEVPADNSASVKTNPEKFNHFEFGEKEFVPKSHSSKPSRHGSQWDFADFTTPQKVSKAARDRNQRHFSLEDNDDTPRQQSSKLPHVPHARPDVDDHFDLGDETPKPPKVSVGSQALNHNRSLYEDRINGGLESTTQQSDKHLFGTEQTKPVQSRFAVSDNEKLPFGDITNVKTKMTQNTAAHHRNIFSSQWELTDEPPAKNGRDENTNASVTNGMGKKAANMHAAWDTYHESPQQLQPSVRLTANGFGGRTGDSNWWEV